MSMVRFAEWWTEMQLKRKKRNETKNEIIENRTKTVGFCWNGKASISKPDDWLNMLCEMKMRKLGNDWNENGEIEMKKFLDEKKIGRMEMKLNLKLRE